MIRKVSLLLWLLAVHAFALLAMLETDLLYRIDRKLGMGLLSPPEMTEYHENMLGSHLQMDGSVANGSVIFLGDSLTQGLNVAAVSTTQADSTPAINYGIGMDTTLGLLTRVPQYSSLKNASQIVICIGINDLIRTTRSDAEILENYQRILEALPNDVPVLIQTLFPVDERVGMHGFNTRIRALNSALAQLAEREGHGFLDVHRAVVGEDGNLKAALHTGDGVHLSTAGYAVWIEMLKTEFTD